jgi:hypothetical protein
MTASDLSAVLRPEVGTAVKPTNNESFVYVLRDDTDYVARELRKRLHVTGDDSTVEAHIAAAYKVFLDGLYQAFTIASGTKSLELHVYSSHEVERVRNELLIPTAHAVALDPLCESPGAIHLGLSRWYHPGGSTLAGEGFRPGFPNVADQLTKLRNLVGDEPVVLIEDDMYTGETLASTAADLRTAGINVKQVVVGIQICQSDLAINGVQTASAVRYILDRQRALSEQIDLGDPRDYLIGLSGLVILMDSTGSEPTLGRAPYILPFVRPSDRASFPADSDWSLSMTILELSRDFYGNLSGQTGEDIRVAHCDPEFASFVEHQLGTTFDEKMVDLIDHIMADARIIADRIFGTSPSRV